MIIVNDINEKGKYMSYLLKDFGKLLKRNYKELRQQYTLVSTNCMRLYDQNLQEIPVSVDMYNGKVLITDYGLGIDDEKVTPESLCRTAAAMIYVKREDVIYKYRGKLQNHQQHKKTNQLPRQVIVSENGLNFLVDLGQYSDTGLFLDHSVTRKLVMQESAQRSILNLFCYTGSFTVYAAAGWAKKIVSVDLSGPYLKWAEKNMEINSLVSDTFSFVQDDCKNFLNTAEKKKERFDLIILDPPSFSNSRKTDQTFNVQRDHVEYIRQSIRLLHEDGSVLFSTNLSNFKLQKQQLKECFIKEITYDTIPPGYSRKRLPHTCWVISKHTLN
ncbi:MAG: class I SAM-dependent methyltransferase [Spirochaetaceae bacterium]|nr:class I SAM-dependent methyltransferase [Spirochaetaceae bacterium]MBL7007339.1 class I SAM-dependent methyltransferase [Spirochaetia bacterium]